MATSKVRKGVNRAGWTREHRDYYSTHFFLISVLVAVLMGSWWALLGAMISLELMAKWAPTRVLIFIVMALPWGAVAAGCGLIFFSSTAAAWVLGILGFGISYVRLEAGEMYWNDLNNLER